jgi:hypothetical protein
MSTNCLVTKIKGSVSNPNLKKLGHVVLDLQSASNNYCRFLNSNADRDIELTLLSGKIDRVQGDATLIDSTHAIIHYGTNQYTGFFTQTASEQFKVDISNYYDLKESMPTVNTSNDLPELLQYSKIIAISIEATDIFDVSSISNAVLLNIINFGNSGYNNRLYGDFSFLQNFTSLTSFNLNSTKIGAPINNFTPALFSNLTSLKTLILNDNKVSSFVGNITEFGSLVNLTTLRLQGCNIEGTVEDFVAAQIAAGRATCSGIAIGANMGTNVTFQGVAITSPEAKRLSWTSASNITIVKA